MKNLIIAILILSLGLNSINSLAAPVGSAFTYQGYLTDGGVPANGLYDIFFGLHPENTGQVNNALEVFDVQVTNGLFTIQELDFGNMNFDGDDLWLSVSFRQAASIIGISSYTSLNPPRQRINAVPYAVQAEFLAPNGANANDVLQFDGSNWVASALSINTPWTNNGSSISYIGKVGIGVVNSGFSFQVKQSNAAIDPVEVTDSTGVGMFRIKSNGDVGIRIVNPQARLHLNSVIGNDPFRVDVGFQKKFSINADGNVGIGDNVTPGAKLQVEAQGAQDAVQFRIDGNTKFRVNSSTTYIGTNVTSFANANGMMKYMVSAGCGSSPSILSSYTGIASPPGGITISSSGAGTCTITFPTDINTRYFQASARSATGNRAVSCGFHATNSKKLLCNRFTSSTGAVSSGPIMVLIY